MRYAMQGQYVLWIAVSTIGLLQATAAYYRWDGLLFFRGRPRLGYVMAAVLIPVSYFWFFSYNQRNVPGLEGWQLFSRFAEAALLGLAIVLIVSSLLNAGMRSQSGETAPATGAPGIDALRHDTFFHLIMAATRRRAPADPPHAAMAQSEDRNG
jgi:hypothetical protein